MLRRNSVERIRFHQAPESAQPTRVPSFDAEPIERATGSQRIGKPLARNLLRIYRRFPTELLRSAVTVFFSFSGGPMSSRPAAQRAQPTNVNSSPVPPGEPEEFLRRRTRLAQLLGRLLARDWLRRQRPGAQTEDEVPKEPR